MRTTKMIDVTADGDGDWFRLEPGVKTFHAGVSGSGAVSATLEVKIRNSPDLSPVVALTFSLSGTDADADADSFDLPYNEVMVSVSSLSGSGARAILYMATEGMPA